MSSSPEVESMERRTICFPHYGSQSVLQHGDDGFRGQIDRLYSAAENNALEEVINLKRALSVLTTEKFWPAVTEGMAKILGAEICFVMKRVLVDDQESAVEMPPLGEPGSCMMAAAFHYCANDGTKNTIKSTKFYAYGCPCAYMRHDKVFVIPERLNDFITNNPNKLPTPAEAYIALPVFDEGRCFAHFGAMWSVEGAPRRKLSWAFVEMILHAFEDQIAKRFLAGSNFIRSSQAPVNRNTVIPHDAVTVAQSLRPYAGSLSHELRTPMQGIVGMLDIMYTTVQEAVESHTDPRLRSIFATLKENIETVQDSSRRAVEAADNVVHAYDMDMSVPDAPAERIDDPSEPNSTLVSSTDARPEILVAGSDLPLSRSNKRRRDEAFSRGERKANPNKFPKLEQPCTTILASEMSQEIENGRKHANEMQHQSLPEPLSANSPFRGDFEFAAGSTTESSRVLAPGLRYTSLHELIQSVINEGLKLGGRPDTTIAQATEYGESIEIRTRKSDGVVGQKTIEWSIDPSVPSTLYIDEKDLNKLISCVFLNAVKFTDNTHGYVGVHAKMSRNRYISIKISDNGPGIPAAFWPKLFKPFSQENASITRSSDGLGLGLMVAKGLARKLGGDLMCTRSDTEGPGHGTEFEIKIPLQAGEIVSRPGSPFGSPLPRRLTVTNTEAPHFPPLPAPPGSPRKWAQVLQDAINEAPNGYPSHLPIPGTPPSPRSLGPFQLSGAKPVTSSTATPLSSSPIIDNFVRIPKTGSSPEIDRGLASKYPLTFLVAEDNKINRKLLVSMLSKFGYTNIHEAHDGAEAVRQMAVLRSAQEQIDVVLMDLWMPLMDGYEATERILNMHNTTDAYSAPPPTVLAVTADVTDNALERAARVGMKGFMTKPYKLIDLQRLITEYCASYKRGPTSTNATFHPISVEV